MFLSIITRTMPGRAELLRRCMDSIRAQDRAAEHVLLTDEIGVGVAQAQGLLHQAQPHGEYVLVLDDDDFLSGPQVVRKLQDALAAERPPFAVVKVSHGEMGMMPSVWEQMPREGQITVSNVVVRQDVFYAHRGEFGLRYAGDFDYVRSLFDLYEPAWIDLDVVTVEMRRMGEPGLKVEG